LARAVAQIDGALAEAQRCGMVKFLNSEYRRPPSRHVTSKRRRNEFWMGASFPDPSRDASHHY
jgi:hypothetical protein